jgi:hypothetical protein
MKRFRVLMNRKVLLAALAVVIGVGIYVAAMPKADALIVAPGVCAYYSDAKYKTVVGARGTGCCGEVISWGIVTKYKKCERLYCLDVLCPN